MLSFTLSASGSRGLRRDPENTTTEPPSGSSPTREVLAFQSGKIRLLPRKLQIDILGMNTPGLKPLCGVVASAGRGLKRLDVAGYTLCGRAWQASTR